MPPSQLAPVRSAETPVVSALTRQLVEAIDNGESYQTLFVIVKKMGEEFRCHDNDIEVRKVLKAFEEEDDTGNPLRTLFLTIPRPTLRKVALRTIAYELYDENSGEWGSVYSPGGPSAYFISFSIKDRQGAGLKGSEYRRVIGIIEKYKLACETWIGKRLDDDDYGQSQLTQEEQEALKTAMDVDNQYLQENKEWTESQRFSKPRFCGPIKNITHMIAMLERRGDIKLDSGVCQLSSPCYVGCSKEISGPMINHSPDSTSLRDTSNVWGMFLSCLAHMGLRPRVCQVPILKCWEEGLVPLAEILVTVIAGSLVLDDGFNVIQPGTSSKVELKNQDAFEKCKEDVWVYKTFFKDNLQEALDQQEDRKAMNEAFEGFNSVMSTEELGQMESTVVELENELLSSINELEQFGCRLEAEVAAKEKILVQLDALIEDFKKMGVSISDCSDSEDDGPLDLDTLFEME